MSTPLTPEQPAVAGAAPFRGLERPARLVVVLVCCAAFADLVSLPVELRLAEFYRALGAGEYSQEEATRTAEAIDAFSFPLTIAEVVAFLVAGIAYIVWFRRARANLPRLGAVELPPGTGWAVAAWLIPLVSLVMPKVIHDEIWRASDPDLPWPAQRAVWDRVRVPVLHHVWWAAFVVGGLLETIGSRLTDADDLGTMRIGVLMWAAASLVFLLAAALVVSIVLAVTARQRARAARSPWP
ncbi:DUF4328 domain-containing protein [Pseudonocardia sp. DSM 110487]|uniref:DUF4328 domain-containing protein n=1 Tax=Pseudonocardia sp. DSM 110487 TaxID=2865833 RepID=UPI001C697D79|nr:DUF4328 domain-containing protein [Pseudonocardia sp. DSM 110487]QYN34167.1 DUF4328 domain-containing protein [Pseudonocardia sp. DSM 110487]